jgi:hypothetical protein
MRIKILGIILLVLPLAFAYIVISLTVGKDVAILICVLLACIVSIIIGLWLLLSRPRRNQTSGSE